MAPRQCMHACSHAQAHNINKKVEEQAKWEEFEKVIVKEAIVSGQHPCERV